MHGFYMVDVMVQCDMSWLVIGKWEEHDGKIMWTWQFNWILMGYLEKGTHDAWDFLGNLQEAVAVYWFFVWFFVAVAMDGCGEPWPCF